MSQNPRTFTSLDIPRIRAQTPGCDAVIHLHNSGASLMPEPVFEATWRHLERELHMGGYEAASSAESEVANFYVQASRMFGCDASEIAFMENATAAWNAIFYGFARTLGRGDRILTANAEYASNYIAYLHIASITGCEIVAVPDDAHGQLDVATLESMIDERVKLISITHVPTNGGLVNPAAAVGAVARRHAIPYLLDACQSAGQMPLDVQQLGCDAMSCTGRKYLRGPRGTGILYVRTESVERLPPATLDLHGAMWTGPGDYEMLGIARRYESFEGNVAGQIGLGVALEYANDLGLDAIYERNKMLSARVRGDLSAIPGITVRDKGLEQCAIVTFTHDHLDAATIRAGLAECGINVGTSNAHSTLLDMRDRGIESLVRCALHYFNTEEELQIFCERLETVLANTQSGRVR
jgi:cysteine desulfurase / selenocysteine lyase